MLGAGGVDHQGRDAVAAFDRPAIDVGVLHPGTRHLHHRAPDHAPADLDAVVVDPEEGVAVAQPGPGEGPHAEQQDEAEPDPRGQQAPQPGRGAAENQRDHHDEADQGEHAGGDRRTDAPGGNRAGIELVVLTVEDAGQSRAGCRRCGIQGGSGLFRRSWRVFVQGWQSTPPGLGASSRGGSRRGREQQSVAGHHLVELDRVVVALGVEDAAADRGVALGGEAHHDHISLDRQVADAQHHVVQVGADTQAGQLVFQLEGDSADADVADTHPALVITGTRIAELDPGLGRIELEAGVLAAFLGCWLHLVLSVVSLDAIWGPGNREARRHKPTTRKGPRNWPLFPLFQSFFANPGRFRALIQRSNSLSIASWESG
ncbi:hypothetical protein BJP37_25025 [Moorena bouillonii PNG]|uniref:Uncharacterized protein n=1 Tax=Moorena bouillonii PNG TaxID=568701 RepID=A0A1U7N775_9CYAN|nr:hypothetical protein BJP37_25025 [Moorena bouillonii PNG]